MALPDGPVVIYGAGGIGGYVGGMLSLAGHEVILVDGWPEHVEAVRRNGLQIDGPDGRHDARPRIAHLGDLQELRHSRPALIVLSVKLYDTEWVATLARDCLARGTPLVTLQNALVEETVARIAGWTRVLGGIATGMNVELKEPGRICRSSNQRFGAEAVFKIGEMHGRMTPRASAIARMLSCVDTSVVTTNLWNDRWQKLCVNAMVSGLSAISGTPVDVIHARPEGYLAALHLGAEACAVGQALGFDPGTIFGIEPVVWCEAARDEGSPARQRTRMAFEAQASKTVPGYVSGSLQDVRRGRRTEIEYLNGYISMLGEEAGIPTPVNDHLVKIVRDIEWGRRGSSIDNLDELVADLR